MLAFKTTYPVAGVESHLLFQNSLSAVVSTNHKEKVTLDELKKYELALPSKGLQVRNAFDFIVANYDGFRIRVELNEVNILLKLIRQTNPVTVLAEDSIYNEHNIKAIPIDVHDNDMSGCVHIVKGAYHKQAMKKFIRILSESLSVKRRQNSWI